MEKMEQTNADCNPECLDHTLNDLKSDGERAAKQGLALLFHLVGSSDVGETTALPDGYEVRRLGGLHPRAYQSVLGSFAVERTVDGSCEGQKIEYGPVDTQLQLPESDFSYLLQDWAQGLAVEQADRRVPETLGRILEVKPPVESLERMNQKMAQSVRGFRESRPAPEPEAEGALCVVSADGKGIPIRRPSADVPIEAHDRDQKPKTNRKKMAVVGAVYTIDPFVRTPEEVAASLFRDPDEAAPYAERPEPQHKHWWASLPQYQDGQLISATDETFSWLGQEAVRHNPESDKPTVLRMDGQNSLWEAAQCDLPSDNRIDILDLLHATPRIWEAAGLFYARDSDQAWEWSTIECCGFCEVRCAR